MMRLHQRVKGAQLWMDHLDGERQAPQATRNPRPTGARCETGAVGVSAGRSSRGRWCAPG